MIEEALLLRAIFRTPISGIIMWTKHEECRDSLAAFSQPSMPVATRKIPVKLP